MLALNHITKAFPGVIALDRVNFDVVKGEIHALVGENGAGKSTLTKIVTGIYKPDDGQIEYEQRPAQWHTPKEAKNRGIQAIYQEFVSFKNMSVAENIFIGQNEWMKKGFVSHKKAYSDASKLLSRLGVNIDPRLLIRDLSVADQQIVEIAKALVQKVKLLVLDEPTAVLSGREIDLLFERLRALKDDGVAIIYISHRLEEIFELCDRVTVLKDGKVVSTVKVTDINREELISMMIGRNIEEFYPLKHSDGNGKKEILHVDNLWVENKIKKANFSLYAGEILAIAGLIGAGRTILAQSIFGAVPFTEGSIKIEGKTFKRMKPSKAINLGIGFVTEDRKKYGLAMLLDVKANITAPALRDFSRMGILNNKDERATAILEIQKYKIACNSPETEIRNLSGGNQQKVMISRWARTCKLFLILDEPTRGVDVGAKIEIYGIIRSLADSGVGILMISSELPEIIGMADRVLVMREGSITGELERGNITEENIMKLATAEKI